MKSVFRLPIYLLFLAATLLGLGTSTHAEENYRELPSIGSSADAILSPDEEDRIGRDTVRQLRQLNYLLEDDEIETYLNDLGRRIASHSDRSPDKFRFFVVRDQQINAFALPGGFIGVNAGLIAASRNESELAGVLAHEIAHVTQRHIARQVQANGRFQIATAAALLLAILAGASDPDVVQAAMSVGIATTGQQQINFTRAHESEADRVGIHTLAEAGYDPKGMASFFQYMEERSRLYGNQLPEILQSHPVSNTRIAEALQRVGQYPARTAPDQSEYELMQARLRVLSVKQVSSAIEFFAPENAAPPKVRQYGQALAYYRSGQYPTASKMLQTLTQTHPEDPHYALALAQVQLSAGQLDKALSGLESQLRDHPQYGPLILLYADALLQSNRPEEARRLLRNHSVPAWQDAEMHRLLAQAARSQEQLPEAYFQMAEYYRRIDDYRSALDQVDAGLALASLSTIDKARLGTLKKSLESEAPEKDKDRRRGR